MHPKRNTVQKQLVLDAVKELNTHATAEQVYEHIVKSHPSISKATVYRNLGAMAERGELLNIGVLQGSARYDHNCHEHGHFICERCGRVFDVDCALMKMAGGVKDMEGFEITAYTLTFSGFCRDCKAKAAREAN